jgi:hypothetical protein
VLGQFTRRGREILSPPGPTVEPDHANGSFAVGLTEKLPLAVGTQHEVKATYTVRGPRKRHALPVASE